MNAAFAVLVTLGLSVCMSTSPDDEVALRRAIASTEAKIETLRLIYDARHRNSEELIRGDHYVHRIMYVAKPASLYVHSAHGNKVMAWEDDPAQQAAHVFERSHHIVFPLQREFVVHPFAPGDGLPGTLNEEFFLSSTGIWPFVGVPPPTIGDTPVMLEDVVRSDRYTLRMPLETRHGRQCFVLVNSERDVLWIDAERFVLVSREVRDPSNGALEFKIDLTRHKEFARGIWLPTRLSNVQFDHTASDEAARQRRVLDAEIDVRELAVNSPIDPSVFEFTAPDGALRTQRLRPEQVRAGGEDLLDEVANWIRRHSPPAPAQRAASSYMLDFLIALAVAASLEMSARIIRRRSWQASSCAETKAAGPVEHFDA
jgi:hypothetical protein